MQISDQTGSLVRLGSNEFLCPRNDVFRQAQPLRDGDTARSSRHAHAQPVGRHQMFLVEFHGGIQYTSCGRRITLQAVVVRGR